MKSKDPQIFPKNILKSDVLSGSKSSGVESYDARIRPTSVNMRTNETGEQRIITTVSGQEVQVWRELSVMTVK